MSQSRWTLPQDLLEHSIAVMQPHGARGNEGLALWFGVDSGQSVRITHAVEVFGRGFQTTPLFMSLSMRAMASLTEFADQRKVFLAGQIHSHPGTLLDLSELDEAKGIRTPNYLSVVCPFYAQRPEIALSACGVHVFERNRYRRMATAEITRRIRFDSAPVHKLRVEVRP